MERPARPTVTLTGTISLDGRITVGRDRILLDPQHGASWHALHPPSAGPVAERRTADIAARHRPTATLAGSGSFVVDGVDPAPLPAVPDADRAALYTDHLPPEVTEHPDHRDWFAVADGRGRVRWTFTGADGTDLLVLVARSTPAEYLAFLRRERICFLLAGDDGVDPALALERLRDRLGVRAVIADGGGELTASLLRAGLVDEVDVLLLPALIGGRDTPSLVGGDTIGDADAPTRLRLRDVRAEDDGLVRLRYDVVHDVRDG